VVLDVAEERSLSSQLIQSHIPEEMNLQHCLRNLKSRKDPIIRTVSLPTKGNQQQNSSALNWKLATTKTSLVDWTEGNPKLYLFHRLV
jgi:hypothetical protein